MNYYNKELAEKECSIQQKGGRKKKQTINPLTQKNPEVPVFIYSLLFLHHVCMLKSDLCKLLLKTKEIF